MIPRVIFDTDIGCDCDDAAALGIALELMKTGECELVGVTVCTASQAAGGCAEAILNYYGHPEISVGCLAADEQPVGTDWHDVYATSVAKEYDTQFTRGITYENTVKLLRRLLAESEKPITLVATGALTSLALLIESGPDEYSPLSGVELVKEKVKLGVCMGGRFHQAWPEPVVLGDGYRVDVEWNISCDIPASRTVCEKWPSELVFCSYEIGIQMITCKNLQKNGPADNPIRRCYECWHQNDGGYGRESWDSATMLYAIRPEAGYFHLYPYGKIWVDEKGCTFWREEEAGRQSFLTERRAIGDVEEILEEILDRNIVSENR